MAMAEICSAMPTAGGLYYWSAKLAKTPEGGTKASWYTGWFNLVGQIGVIASVDYALSVFIAYFVGLYADSWFGMPILDYKSVFIIYICVLIAHGLLNTFGVGLVKFLADVSVWWHVFGAIILVVILFSIPSSDNVEGLGSIFDFENLTGWSFPGSGLYVFLIGMLIAQYTITGFDASAHVSEETKGANVSAPKAILRSIYISAMRAGSSTSASLYAMPKGSYANGLGRRPVGGSHPGAAADHGDLGRRQPVEADDLHRHRRAVLLWNVRRHRQLPNGVHVQP